MTTITEGRRPAPLSRVWSGMKTIAEDLTGEDLGDVLELHSDASAWWVLTRDDPHSAEVGDVASALDLDDLALKDLLARDGRAKYEEGGQARLVITNAVSVDPERARVTPHPLSIIATDRALICWPTTVRISPAELIKQGRVLAREGLTRVQWCSVQSAHLPAEWRVERSSDDLSDVLFDAHALDKPAAKRAS